MADKDAKDVNSPDIPGGLPPTDPTKPKWSLTQDQIDWLSEQIPSIWPAFKTYWPIIAMIAAGFGISGFGTGRVTAPIEKVPPVVVVAPSSGGDVIIPPQTKQLKLTLFSTASVDAKKIAADPLLKDLSITVDAKIYAEGSAYPIDARNMSQTGVYDVQIPLETRRAYAKEKGVVEPSR